MTTPHRHAIEADEFIPCPSNRIWEALTDPEEPSQWFMSSDFQPEVGHEFSIDMGNRGTTKCTVLEVVPQELIRYTWKNPPLDTVVTWKLIPEGQGTRVFVEHSGFDLDDPIQLRAHKGIGSGWKISILAQLAVHVQD